MKRLSLHNEQATLWDGPADPALSTATESFVTPPYQLVTTAAQLEVLLPRLLAAAVVGIDTETTGLDPLCDRLRLVQLAMPELTVVVDVQTCPVHLLAPLFAADRELLFHNGVFDLRFLTTAGLPWPRRLWDTMLMSQLLGAGRAEGTLSHCGLETVVSRVLGLTLPKAEQRSHWEGELTTDQIEYAVRDAAVLLPLAARLKQAVRAGGLERVAAIEHRCIPALAWLELAGLPLDAQRWLARAQHDEERVRTLEAQLHAGVGRERSQLQLQDLPLINWQSPKQVLAVLRARGHQIHATNAATLATVDDPLAPLLLDYREAVIHAGTFGREWVERHQHPVTNRIHAEYLQCGTPAGRMSCLKPNVQNLPRSPAYRSCIRADDGCVIVKADFSQIELRIAAVLAQDAAMLAAFRNGWDLHAVTAATVLGIPLTQVGKAHRQVAKSLNFGLMYGMGARGLRDYAAKTYNVTLTEQAARQHRQAFFQTYRGLARWHGQTAARLARHATVEARTVTGRRLGGIRYFTHLLNMPVQGTGADGLKLALARLFEYRQEAPEARLIATVHDEIVAECPVAAAAQTVAWLTRHMRAAMDELLEGVVPIEVEVQVGSSWAG